MVYNLNRKIYQKNYYNNNKDKLIYCNYCLKNIKKFSFKTHLKAKSHCITLSEPIKGAMIIVDKITIPDFSY